MTHDELVEYVKRLEERIAFVEELAKNPTKKCYWCDSTESTFRKSPRRSSAGKMRWLCDNCYEIDSKID